MLNVRFCQLDRSRLPGHNLSTLIDSGGITVLPRSADKAVANLVQPVALALIPSAVGCNLTDRDLGSLMVESLSLTVGLSARTQPAFAERGSSASSAIRGGQ